MAIMTKKTFCEKYNIDPEKVMEFVIGEGGSILPQKIGMQGYFGILTETSIIFQNDVLKVKKEVPFSSFTRAEFGIGSAQLWLQCVVDGSPFVFCFLRRHWKSSQAKYLLDKIGEHTTVEGWKEYNGYTGKLFLIYMWK